MTRLGMVIDLDRCIGCHACSVGCAVSRALPAGDRWSHVKEYVTGSFPALEITYLPTLCMQCSSPACLDACPTGATYIDDEGVIQVDKSQCIGCGSCESACPYHARTVLGTIESNHGGAGPTPPEKILFAARTEGVAEKCTFCSDRRANGDEPLCVKTCVADAHIFGDLDDPTSAVAKAASSGQRLLENVGTEPNVYYLYSGTNNLDEAFTV